MSLNQPTPQDAPRGFPPQPPFPPTAGNMPPGYAQPLYGGPPPPPYTPPAYVPTPPPPYGAPPGPPYSAPQYSAPPYPVPPYPVPPYPAPQYPAVQYPPPPPPPLRSVTVAAPPAPVVRAPPPPPPNPVAPSPPVEQAETTTKKSRPRDSRRPRAEAKAKKQAGPQPESRAADNAPNSKSPPKIIADPPLVAQPVGAADEAALLAAEEREELENTRRAIIAGATSMIVHLVILITLGLMDSTPKTEKLSGIELEASVEKLDDKLLSEAARIDMTKPETVDAGRPVGLPNMPFLPSVPTRPNVVEGYKPPTEPPKLFGPSDIGPGDMPPGVVHKTPGDGNGATFFDIPATGRKIAFVVDTSGSMFDNGRYLRCRSELIESLRTLKPKQYYYVVLFSDRLFPMPGRRLTEATPSNLYRTIAWLNGADPTGTTEPLPALKQALQQRPDAIFLLTDGSFEDGTLEKILKLQTSSKKVPIHTIAFEGQDGEAALKQIARATGGRYRYVP